MTGDTGKTVNTENASPRLTFENGNFRLSKIPKTLIPKLSKNPYWRIDGKDFITQNLGAAVQYRERFADRKTEKLFNRILQAYYPLPDGPPPLLKEIIGKIDPHQYDGILWMLTRKRSYLAHAPGAGKTCEAILASCLAQGPGQTVFIVPPGLTENWRREIEKFTEWVGIWPSIGIIPRSAEWESTAWNADFLIVPDSMLTRDWVQAELTARRKRFKFVAVDEASRFKEPTALRSIAFYGGAVRKIQFPGIFQFARHVVFMDGSPMPNRPIELWAPAFALDPGSIGYRSYDDFGYRYCGAKPNSFGQWEYLYSSNEVELRDSLQKSFMHVVPEDALEHPERRRSMLFMDRDVRSVEQKSWERRHLRAEKVFTENESQGDLARFRRELGIAKIPWIAGYTDQRLSTKKESILLFAWHREVCTGLSESLTKWKPGLIMGGVGTAEREHFYDLFQRGVIRLLVLNIGAAGRGLNLQRADRVIFGEWSWTDETNRQCEKRASRKGSVKDFVRCEYIVSPGSLDERVLTANFAKAGRVKRIIG